MRRWIDLTNEAQHGGTREVSLERAEEKKSVDRQRRSDGVDLCSLRSLTRVPSIGPARTCRVSSRLKHSDHTMESLSNDAL